MKSPTKLPWLSDYYYANDNSSQDNVRDVLFHFYNISPFIERTPLAVSRQATKPFLTLRGSFIICLLAGGLCRAISISLSLTEYCSIVLYYYLNKRAWHIRCAHSQESIDDDAYTLLALVAGYYACYACEFTFNYPYLLTRLEFLHFFC